MSQTFSQPNGETPKAVMVVDSMIYIGTYRRNPTKASSWLRRVRYNLNYVGTYFVERNNLANWGEARVETVQMAVIRYVLQK